MDTGDGLIFIISLPRSGSTLLQRMFACHPEIQSVSEPFTMYHPFTPLQQDRYVQDLRLGLVQRGLQQFLALLPGKEEDYIEGVRRMYGYLYERAREASGKRYICDKSPIYHFVLPELSRTFPDARYVVLLRNPLAVLHSVVNLWAERRWWNTARIWDELVEAPRTLVDGAHALGDRAVVVQYERVVAGPETEMRRLCTWLGLEFLPDMIEYGSHDLPRSFGDPVVSQHQRPVGVHADTWRASLANPQFWRLAGEYLALLDQGVVNRMGYPYDALREAVGARRPHPLRLWGTVSYRGLRARQTVSRTPGVWSRGYLAAQRLLVGRGVAGTVGTALRAVARAVENAGERASDARDPLQALSNLSKP